MRSQYDILDLVSHGRLNSMPKDWTTILLRIPSEALRTFLVLCNQCDEDQKVSLTQQEIADLANKHACKLPPRPGTADVPIENDISPRTVRRHISTLMRAGCIEHAGETRTATVYQIARKYAPFADTEFVGTSEKICYDRPSLDDVPSTDDHVLPARFGPSATNGQSADLSRSTMADDTAKDGRSIGHFRPPDRPFLASHPDKNGRSSGQKRTHVFPHTPFQENTQLNPPPPRSDISLCGGGGVVRTSVGKAAELSPVGESWGAGVAEFAEWGAVDATQSLSILVAAGVGSARHRKAIASNVPVKLLEAAVSAGMKGGEIAVTFVDPITAAHKAKTLAQDVESIREKSAQREQAKVNQAQSQQRKREDAQKALDEANKERAFLNLARTTINNAPLSTLKATFVQAIDTLRTSKDPFALTMCQRAARELGGSIPTPADDVDNWPVDHAKLKDAAMKRVICEAVMQQFSTYSEQAQ